MVITAVPGANPFSKRRLDSKLYGFGERLSTESWEPYPMNTRSDDSGAGRSSTPLPVIAVIVQPAQDTLG